MKKALLLLSVIVGTSRFSVSAQTKSVSLSSNAGAEDGNNMIKFGAVEFGAWDSNYNLSFLGLGGAYERTIAPHFTVQLEGDYYWRSNSYYSSTVYFSGTTHYLTFTPEIRYFFTSVFDGFYVAGNASEHFVISSYTSNFAQYGITGNFDNSYTALGLSAGGYFHVTRKIYGNIGGNVGIVVAHSSPGGGGFNIWNGLIMAGYRF